MTVILNGTSFLCIFSTDQQRVYMDSKNGKCKEDLSCNPHRFYPKMGSAKNICPVILIGSILKWEVQRRPVL
jgi:hypothetical protein